MASTCTPTDMVTYDQTPKRGEERQKDFQASQPPPSQEAAGWPPRAVSKPAHPSGQRAAAPFQGAAHRTAAVRSSYTLAARLRCPRPGLPGQPEAAGPLAASAMRRPRQRPPAARPRPSLSFPRNRRTGEERQRPGRHPHRPAGAAGDSTPSRQAALRQRAPPAQLPTSPPPPGAHRGSTRRARARALPASAGWGGRSAHSCGGHRAGNGPAPGPAASPSSGTPPGERAWAISVRERLGAYGGEAGVGGKEEGSSPHGGGGAGSESPFPLGDGHPLPTHRRLPAPHPQGGAGRPNVPPAAAGHASPPRGPARRGWLSSIGRRRCWPVLPRPAPLAHSWGTGVAAATVGGG